jgi:zinc and cadmium transporter
MNGFLLPTTGVLGIYCALILLASLTGGWLLLAMRLTHSRLQMAVSFVAGLMLGVALLHFIPAAADHTHSVDQTVHWTLGGFLLMFFLQRFFPHHHHDISEGAAEPHPPGQEPAPRHDEHNEHASHFHTRAPKSAGHLSWAATAIGMSLHSLMGGVAVGAAVAAGKSAAGGWVGLGTALVIILHKPFDAMAVTTMMTASGCSRFARHLLNVLFALVTPCGALLFYGGASQFFGSNPAFLGCALAFCAGTFLCIASADLLPELQFHSHDRLKLSLALAAGLSVAIVIGLLEDSDHDPHAPDSSPHATERVAQFASLGVMNPPAASGHPAPLSGQWIRRGAGAA